MRDLLKRLESLERSDDNAEAARLANVSRLIRERVRHLMGEDHAADPGARVMTEAVLRGMME